jgi:putative membrane protein
MIERYSDHAANERTFLAWVRTAIAIMAFGFVVEKFDLFLSLAAREMASRQPAVHLTSAGGQTFGNIAGLALIVIGCATLVLAIVRFHKTGRDIDRQDKCVGPGDRLDITLGGLLALLGAAMLVYLAYTTISSV